MLGDFERQFLSHRSCLCHAFQDDLTEFLRWQLVELDIKVGPEEFIGPNVARFFERQIALGWGRQGFDKVDGRLGNE